MPAFTYHCTVCGTRCNKVSVSESAVLTDAKATLGHWFCPHCRRNRKVRRVRTSKEGAK